MIELGPEMDKLGLCHRKQNFKTSLSLRFLPGWLLQKWKMMKGPHFHTGMLMRLRLRPAREPRGSFLIAFAHLH